MNEKELYYNNEKIFCPTQGKALNKIADDEKLEERRISALIKVMKTAAELAGYEVYGRIVLINSETKKRWD